MDHTGLGRVLLGETEWDMGILELLRMKEEIWDISFVILSAMTRRGRCLGVGGRCQVSHQRLTQSKPYTHP